MFKARFTFGILVAMLLVGLIGCSSKGGGGGSRGDRYGGGGGSKWFPRTSKWDVNSGVLQFANVGTRFDIRMKPVVDYEALSTGRSVFHVVAAKPDGSSAA